jgi:hypothetical protein
MFALPLLAQRADGYSSSCSDPSRAKILETATILLPSDDIGELEKSFDASSKRIGMTTWAVGSELHGKVLSKTLGLQSPKYSVSITADWKPGDHHALLKVERTCINDDLEPWEGFWSGLRGELAEAGYQLR